MISSNLLSFSFGDPMSSSSAEGPNSLRLSFSIFSRTSASLYTYVIQTLGVTRMYLMVKFCIQYCQNSIKLIQNVYLRSLFIVMPGITEHQPHLIHQSFLRGVALNADVVFDGFHVHGFEDDVVVVRVILFGRFNHKKVTQTPIGAWLLGIENCSVKGFHSVLLDIFLVAWKKKNQKYYTDKHEWKYRGTEYNNKTLRVMYCIILLINRLENLLWFEREQ